MDRNTKNKIKATLFIIIFLLLVAVIVYFITGNKERQYYAVATHQPTQDVETAAPTQEIATPAPTVSVTETPQPTPTIWVVETPQPTVEITPEPVVVGQVVSSGTFSSNTGAYIDIYADYTATTLSSDTVSVSVTVRLSHYTLHAIGGQTLNISCGGQYTGLYVDAIDTDESVQQTTIMGTYDFTVSAPAGQTTSVPLNVEWHFGGSYHGQDLPVLECGGTVNITR